MAAATNCATLVFPGRELHCSRALSSSGFRPSHGRSRLVHRVACLRTTADATSHAPTPSRLDQFWQRPVSLLGLGALTGSGLLGSGFDFSGPESVLQALGVLAAVVGVHEAGHFLAARLQGIHVTKFAIGFGPPLVRYQGPEVEYSLRAFPLGGFVAFPDDDPKSPYLPEDPNLLRNRPVADRAIVTSAGVIANVIAAFATCVIQASTVGVAEPVYFPGVKLGNISPGTVAATAGFQRNDILLRVGDLQVAPSPKAVGEVVAYIQRSAGKSLHVELDRSGTSVGLDVTPVEVADGTGRIGVSLGPNVRVDKKKATGPVEALRLGSEDFSALLGTVLKGLMQIITNFQQTAEKVSGPVAMIAFGSEVARTDASNLFQFAALINLNLAVVNILPLPALDGGYLALQLIEAVRGGRKLDVEVERVIMAGGFLLLSSLALFLIVRDTLHLTALL